MRYRPARLPLTALILFVSFIAAPAARADWRDELQVLRVGVMTGANTTYRLAQLEPFRTWLENRLSIPVELVPAGDYAALIDAQAGDRVQYAIHSASSFVTLDRRCQCVEPIAVPTRAGGEAGFYALLVSLSKGPVRSLDDARGKRLAVAAEDSVAGYLLPMQAFAEKGIDPETYFSGIVETANPEMAISALLADTADLAVAWSSLNGEQASGYSFGVLRSFVADGSLSMDQLRIVWKSPLIPFGPHVVRSDLPDEAKDAIREALLGLAAENPEALTAVDRFGGQGFVAANAEMFAPVMALVTPNETAQEGELPSR